MFQNVIGVFLTLESTEFIQEAQLLPRDRATFVSFDNKYTLDCDCDVETGVRGHSRSLKAALFDRTHMTLYLSSMVNVSLSLTVSEK